MIEGKIYIIEMVIIILLCSVALVYSQSPLSVSSLPPVAGLVDIDLLPTLNYFVSLHENGSFSIWDSLMSQRETMNVGCKEKVLSV